LRLRASSPAMNGLPPQRLARFVHLRLNGWMDRNSPKDPGITLT
jgi:hypothetical protein